MSFLRHWHRHKTRNSGTDKKFNFLGEVQDFVSSLKKEKKDKESESLKVPGRDFLRT